MKAKLREWLWRYLPLEIAATIFALGGGFAAASFGFNGAVIAYAAAWAENTGFYGTALIRELRRSSGGERLSIASAGPRLVPTVRALATEFGPAELLDSFIVRPGCMYLLPLLTGDLALGLICGKVLADVAFFGLAIVAYELGKSRR